MPVKLEIDHAHQIVLVTVTGVIRDEDLLAQHERLRSDPTFDPEHSQLVDLRAASGSEVTPEGVQALADHSPLFSPRSRRAVVVATDLGYGMARMFELMRDDTAGALRVFRSRTEAERWLAVADESD